MLSFPTDLPVLNEYLSARSFVEFPDKPSTNDMELLKKLEKVSIDADKFPHVSRWARCVSFHAEKNTLAAAQSELANLAICGSQKCCPATAKPAADKQEDEEELDLFGSDEEDPEAEALKAQRVAEYTEKKAKKPAVTAKSLVTLDIKPWEDTTDLVEMEKCIREIKVDGLVWGTSKLIPIGYGIKKLQISCAIEDAKVSMDSIEEDIMALEDFVQSVDIVSFNKI